MRELDALRAIYHHGSCGGFKLFINFVFIRSGVAARVTVWGEGYLGWVVALRDVLILTRSYELFGTPLS